MSDASSATLNSSPSITWAAFSIFLLPIFGLYHFNKSIFANKPNLACIIHEEKTKHKK